MRMLTSLAAWGDGQKGSEVSVTAGKKKKNKLAVALLPPPETADAQGLEHQCPALPLEGLFQVTASLSLMIYGIYETFSRSYTST